MLTDIHQNAAWLAGDEASNAITIPNFLPEQQRNALFEALIRAKNAFYYRIAAGKRSSENMCFSPDDSDYLPREFLSEHSKENRDKSSQEIIDACRVYQNAILPKISELKQRLNIAASPAGKLPLTIVNGQHKSIALPHKDQAESRQMISLLYYLHNKPKPFSGGDLQLYPTSPSDPNVHGEAPSYQIAHSDNLLVVFPSNTFHGTTPVDNDSTQFEDGRFAFVSFV